MHTVASISFRDDHSLSMDVLDVSGLVMGPPVRLDDGTWAVELVVHTHAGKVSLQMTGDAPERFKVAHPEGFED